MKILEYMVVEAWSSNDLSKQVTDFLKIESPEWEWHLYGNHTSSEDTYMTYNGPTQYGGANANLTKTYKFLQALIKVPKLAVTNNN